MTDSDQAQPIDQPRTKILKNGAVYDLDRKRIVANPGGGLAAFDSDTARLAQAHKLELKRQRLMQGAAKVLERSGDWEAPNDLDVVEAIGEAVVMKALDPTQAKQVDAARFMLQEAGLAEARQQEQPQQQGISQDALDKLYVIAQAVLARQQAAGSVIDADADDV